MELTLNKDIVVAKVLVMQLIINSFCRETSNILSNCKHGGVGINPEKLLGCCVLGKWAPANTLLWMKRVKL